MRKKVSLEDILQRQLISDNGINEDKNDEDIDDYIDEDDIMLDAIVTDKDITVEKQEIELSDLKVNDFIIVPVEDRRNKTHYWPAQITKLRSDGSIHIDYMKQDFDHPEKLQKCSREEENNWIIPYELIVMKLPEPKEQCRGRYIFSGKIILNK